MSATLPKEWADAVRAVKMQADRADHNLYSIIDLAVERCYALHTKPRKQLSDADYLSIYSQVFPNCGTPPDNEDKYVAAICAAYDAKQVESEVRTVMVWLYENNDGSIMSATSVKPCQDRIVKIIEVTLP